MGGLGEAEDAQSIDFLETADGIVGQGLFMSGDVVDAERGNVVEGTGKSMGGDVVGGAGLEFIGKVVVGG